MLLFPILLAAFLAAQPESASLAVVQAGVQSSEDAPFVAPAYQFLPGDYVYFSFAIAGFKHKSANRGESTSISLTYEITPRDATGVPLAPPDSGKIETELNPEDKTWLPVRRFSFVLPSFIAAGEYRIHVSVHDEIAGDNASADYPFQIGGFRPAPAPTLTVERFDFLRAENDRERLEVPAYAPGDTVYARFEMVGYKLGAGNEYHLSYGLRVLRPNGKPFFEQPHAAELQASSFYPAPFLPGVLNLTTSPDTPRGEYVIVLSVRDLIGNQTYETKQAFSIE